MQRRVKLGVFPVSGGQVVVGGGENNRRQLEPAAGPGWYRPLLIMMSFSSQYTAGSYYTPANSSGGYIVSIITHLLITMDATVLSNCVSLCDNQRPSSLLNEVILRNLWKHIIQIYDAPFNISIVRFLNNLDSGLEDFALQWKPTVFWE